MVRHQPAGAAPAGRDLRVLARAAEPLRPRPARHHGRHACRRARSRRPATPTCSAPTSRAATCCRRSSTACASRSSSASASTVIACTIGASVGVAAAYAGGRVENIVMRIVDLQLSFPAILIALVLLAVLGQGRRQGDHRAGHRAVGLLRPHGARHRAGGAQPRIHRGRALPCAAEAAHHVPPSAAELPAAADRRRDRAGGARHRAGGHPLLPRRRRAGHRALARPADRQRLRVPALGQVLDLPLSGHRAAGRHRRHQPGRRPAARRAEPPAAANERDLSSTSGICGHLHHPRRRGQGRGRRQPSPSSAARCWGWSANPAPASPSPASPSSAWSIRPAASPAAPSASRGATSSACPRRSCASCAATASR